MEIPPRSTDEEDADTLVGLTRRAASDLSTIIPAGATFHAKIQWRNASGARLPGRADPPGSHRRAASSTWRWAPPAIDQLAFPERVVLLGVRVDRQAPGFESTTARVKRATGTATAKDEAESMLDTATMREVRTFLERMAASSFRARPATPQQLAWSLRRDLHRVVEQIPEGALIAGGQVAMLKATHVVPAMDHVQITTAEGVRYLRMVTTAENGFPTESLQIPGGEWLKVLDLVGNGQHDPAAPIEVSIRGRNVPAHEAAKRITDALTLTKEQTPRSARRGTRRRRPARSRRPARPCRRGRPPVTRWSRTE